jgi:3-phytase
VRRAIVLVFLSVATAIACSGVRVALPELAGAATPSMTLAGQFSIPSGQRIPPISGLPFGGISGLAQNPLAPGELFGISDAQRGGRVYRFTLGTDGPTLKIDTSEPVVLEASPGDADPADFEGLARLPGGGFLVASEGSTREPRRPPSIDEYGRHGEFVARLPMRERYAPEVRGPLTRGARGNAGFESLAIAPDGRTFFTGVETALVQDGEPAGFDRGTRTRLLEYRMRHGRFEPAREFVYELAPVQRPSFTPGFFINGLVELLVISPTTLLALERGYTESVDDNTIGMNDIRVYRVSLTGATDVSGFDSIKDRQDIVPVQKTLVLDLKDVQGLDSSLAPSLDNFEGMAFGPRLPDGRPTLVLVSDDNFSTRQRTWFLEFAIGSEVRSPGSR